MNEMKVLLCGLSHHPADSRARIIVFTSGLFSTQSRTFCSQVIFSASGRFGIVVMEKKTKLLAAKEKKQ